MTPVPASATGTGVVEALLTIKSDPVTEPAVEGAKVTERAALLAGARVSGRLNPLTPKPDPVTLTVEMITFAVPVLVAVTVCDALDPTVTLPKFRLLGLTPSW